MTVLLLLRYNHFRANSVDKKNKDFLSICFFTYETHYGTFLLAYLQFLKVYVWEYSRCNLNLESVSLCSNFKYLLAPSFLSTLIMWVSTIQQQII